MLFSTQTPAQKIFISYRRDDAQGYAGRLQDSLQGYFGDDRIFRDVEDIQGGSNFAEAIDHALSSADAVIVLIGPRWLNIEDAAGNKRLIQEGDYVRQEVAKALETGLPVFPVLIENAAMPSREELPPSLQELAMKNAVWLSDKRWEQDIQRLSKYIAYDIPGSVVERKLKPIGYAILLSLLASILFSTLMLGLDLIPDASPGYDGGTRFLSNVYAFIGFLGVSLATLLILLARPLIDPARVKWIDLSIAIAVAGVLASALFHANSKPPADTLYVYFGLVATAGSMLAVLNLSGLKAK